MTKNASTENRFLNTSILVVSENKMASFQIEHYARQ